MKNENQKATSKNKNKIELIFSVNGKKVTGIVANLNAPLKVSVQEALKISGNTGRPLEDWVVKYNDQVININLKVKDFNFPENAIIYIILERGEGGNN